jgi:hypothetical protein
MEKTWKPRAAGILCIIAGVLCVIPSIVVAWIYTPIGGALVIVALIPIVGGIYALRRRIWGLALAGSIFALVVPAVLVTLLIRFLAAVLSDGWSPVPTITEILARGWYLIVGFGIPGILATIFIIMGKREFG